MKHFFFLVFVSFSLAKVVNGQSPQGINYQAIALDASGNPLINQAIGLRLSILQGSSSGISLYSEVHLVSTDGGGHFAVVIGSGTNQVGNFSSVNWGNGTKWLKTELDAAGGNNYIVVGNTQFMSVPYALYSNHAASSGTLDLPDGIHNITPVSLFRDSVYTVPPGRNFYINYDHAVVDSLRFNTFIQTSGMFVRSFIGVSPGQTVESEGSGFLVDSTVEWKSINLSCNPFTVPAGKIFVIISQDILDTAEFVLNGRVLRRNICLNVFKAGDVLSSTVACRRGAFNVNGYLRKE